MLAVFLTTAIEINNRGIMQVFVAMRQLIHTSC